MYTKANVSTDKAEATVAAVDGWESLNTWHKGHFVVYYIYWVGRASNPIRQSCHIRSR
jgi:hypothetical protein